MRCLNKHQSYQCLSSLLLPSIFAEVKVACEMRNFCAASYLYHINILVYKKISDISMETIYSPNTFHMQTCPLLIRRLYTAIQSLPWLCCPCWSGVNLHSCMMGKAVFSSFSVLNTVFLYTAEERLCLHSITDT